MADRFDEMARAFEPMMSHLTSEEALPPLAAVLRKVHDEAIEAAANLVQERKHLVGCCAEESYNFTRDWNDGRVFAYQDAEDRIGKLKAGGK